MNDEELKDLHLEAEFSNPVYKVVERAILYTMSKYNYQKYDLVKLIMKTYDGDYRYLSHDSDYRQQVRELNIYFQNKYNHHIMTYEMVRKIFSLKNTNVYESLTKEIAILEQLLRTKENKPVENLCIFSLPMENKKFDDLMYLVEKNDSLKYALAIIYDKIQMGEIDKNRK